MSKSTRRQKGAQAGPTLSLVPREKPATAVEIAQVEFRAIKIFRDLSKDDRLAKVVGLVENLQPMAILASEILVKTKLELIANVESQYDLFGPFLMQLAQATKNTKILVDVIHAAECRLAITLATIEAPGMI